MGKVAKVRRWVWMAAVDGSVARTCESAASTSCSVRNMSTFQSKKSDNLRRAAAGGGTHRGQPGHGVDRVLNRLGDGDLHLVDGHDAVVDGDDDAREVGVGEDGDGNLAGEVDAGDRQDDDEEEDGPGVARNPEGAGLRLFLWAAGGGHYFSSPLPAGLSGSGLPVSGLAVSGLPVSGLSADGLSSSSLAPAGRTLTLVPSSIP